MPEMPKPEDLTKALAAFPPKLSILMKPLTLPEDLFETTVRQAMGFEMPPGPSKMLVTFMESFEEGAPSLPGLPGTQGPETFSERPEEERRPSRVFKEF